MSDSIASRLLQVEARIAAACERSGRNRAEVVLVAVSKFHAWSAIAEARAAGANDFGENYAQELQDKLVFRNGSASDLANIRFHFIGGLQRNKVKQVVGAATLIHSVDSVRLAEEISRVATKQGLRQAVLINVNLGGEASKTGIAAQELASMLHACTAMPGLDVQGLMTMPPPCDNPEDNRTYFEQLRQLRNLARTEAVALPYLSMGMSDDFEVAIGEGATHVRVGTLIFGARQTVPKEAPAL